jgi:hypothetical protein
MNPNFNFDAEGVFDQPIKPLRIKKRRKAKQLWRKHWIVLTDGKKLEARALRQIGPKPPSSQLGGMLARLKEFGLTKPRRFTLGPPSERTKRGRSVKGQVDPAIDVLLDAAISNENFDFDRLW